MEASEERIKSGNDVPMRFTRDISWGEGSPVVMAASNMTFNGNNCCVCVCVCGPTCRVFAIEPQCTMYWPNLILLWTRHCFIKY